MRPKVKGRKKRIKFPKRKNERGWDHSKEWTSEQRKDFEERYTLDRDRRGPQGTLFRYLCLGRKKFLILIRNSWIR